MQGLKLDMNDKFERFLASNNFTVHMNKETDSTYLFIDLGERSSKMNMELQHFHSSYEIFIALDDNVAHIVEGRYLPMRKWDIIFLRPGLVHLSCYERKNGMQKRIVINFSLPPAPGSLDYQMEKLLKPFSLQVPIIRLEGRSLSSMITSLESLLLAAKEKKSGWQIEVLSDFMLFLLCVSRNMNRSDYEASFITDTADRKIYNIVEYMQSNYMENITLADTASRFSVSPYYLSHLFPKITGTSFISYLHRIRVGHALQYLAYSDMKIKDIIRECGFSSASQFNRVFFSFISRNPTQFRLLGYIEKQLIVNKFNPEYDEIVPPAFPPPMRTGILERGRRHHDLILGISSQDFDISVPEDIPHVMDSVGADAIMLDIRKTFPYICSDYSRISEESMEAFRNLGVKNLILFDDSDIITLDSDDRHMAISSIRSLIQFASVISASSIALVPANMSNYGERYSFAFYDSISRILQYAEDWNVNIMIQGMAHSVLPNPQTIRKMLDFFSPSHLSLLFDPLAMIDRDWQNNTFSYFGEFFSALSEDISAIRLRDSLDLRPVALGQGIMAKTFPRIADLVTRSVPVIRDGGSEAYHLSDLAYIRKTFGA